MFMCVPCAYVSTLYGEELGYKGEKTTVHMKLGCLYTLSGRERGNYYYYYEPETNTKYIIYYSKVRKV